MKLQSSLAEYGRRYGRSIATIRKYKEEGLPLDDPVKMAKILEEKTAARRNGGRMQPDNPDANQPGQTAGAAGTELPPGARTFAVINNDIREIELETKRHKLLIAQGKLVNREEVRQAGIKIGSALDLELKRLEMDIPGTCAGLESSELQKRISALFLTLRKNVKKSLNETATAFNLESVN